MRRCAALLFVALFLVLPWTMHADDVAQPDSLSLSSGYAYTHVLDSGGSISDLLILVNYTIMYTTEPDEPTSDTFIVQLLDTDGTTVLATTAPVPFTDNGYGSGSASLYLTDTQVTTLGIAFNDALSVRLQGNPSVFSSPSSTTLSSLTWRPADAVRGFWLSRDILTRSSVLQGLWGVSLVQSTVSGSKLTSTGESYWTLVIADLRTAAPQAFVDTLVSGDFSTQAWTGATQTGMNNFWAGTPMANSALAYLGPVTSGLAWVLIAAALSWYLMQKIPDARFFPMILCPLLFSFAALINMLPIIWAIMFGVGSVVILGWVLFYNKSSA